MTRQAMPKRGTSKDKNMMDRMKHDSSRDVISEESHNRHQISVALSFGFSAVLFFCSYTLPQKYSFNDAPSVPLQLAQLGLGIGLVAYAHIMFHACSRLRSKHSLNLKEAFIPRLLAVECVTGALASVWLIQHEPTHLYRFLSVVLIHRGWSDLEIEFLSLHIRPDSRFLPIPTLAAFIEIFLGAVLLWLCACNHPDFATDADLLFILTARMAIDQFIEKRPLRLPEANPYLSIDHELAVTTMSVLFTAGTVVSLFLMTWQYRPRNLDPYALIVSVWCGLSPPLLGRWVFQAHGGPRHSRDLFEIIIPQSV